jgi:hypothetical protein
MTNVYVYEKLREKISNCLRVPKTREVMEILNTFYRGRSTVSHTFFCSSSRPRNNGTNG